VQSNRIIQTLRNPDAQSFLTENRGKPTDELALRLKKAVSGFDVHVTFDLLSIYNKATKKNPEWMDRFNPAWTQKAYQQGSSDICALYRTGLVGAQGSLLNLSGGIGIDDYFLSKNIEKITSIDADEDVHNLAQYNLNALGCSGVERIHTTAEDAIRTLELEPFDAFYIDPDRRSGGASFLLETTSPSLTELQDILLEHGPVFAKLSPVADLTYLIDRLHHLASIHVVGVNDEVKEIITTQEKDVSFSKITAVELTGEQESWTGEIIPFQPHEQTLDTSYFYAPSSVIAKSGLTPYIAQNEGLSMHGTVHFPLVGSNQKKHLPMFKPHRRLGHFAFHKKRWVKAIQSLGLTECTLISKSTDLKSNQLQNASKLPQSNRIFAYLYRHGNSIQMVVGERLNLR
jgi:hypothetical protein